MGHPIPDELRRAYAGKRVFLTGHTGFKGGWLALWLKELGAEVFGYALAPDTTPALFETAGVASACARSTFADIRDLPRLEAELRESKADVVLHLAAQPLVRLSYEQPLETLETNVMGTAHLLEAVKRVGRPCAVVVVTSDKCYENREWLYGYREDEAMGGHDVYSMSKGAAELVTASWRRSFFHPAKLAATAWRSRPPAPGTWSAAGTGRRTGSSPTASRPSPPGSRSSSGTRRASARGSTSSSRSPATCCRRAADGGRAGTTGPASASPGTSARTSTTPGPSARWSRR